MELVCHEREPSLSHLNWIKHCPGKLPCSSHNNLTTGRLYTHKHTHTHHACTQMLSLWLFYWIPFSLWNHNTKCTTTSRTLRWIISVFGGLFRWSIFLLKQWKQTPNSFLMSHFLRETDHCTVYMPAKISWGQSDFTGEVRGSRGATLLQYIHQISWQYFQ